MSEKLRDNGSEMFENKVLEKIFLFRPKHSRIVKLLLLFYYFFMTQFLAALWIVISFLLGINELFQLHRFGRPKFKIEKQINIYIQKSRYIYRFTFRKRIDASTALIDLSRIRFILNSLTMKSS